MAPRTTTHTSEPTLFIIGGGEDQIGKAALLRRFVKLAGGRRSRIVLVPTASSFQAAVATAYDAVFRRLGAPGPEVVNPRSRAQGHDPALIARLDAASGVFMSGGSQLKLSQYFPGTPLGDAIHRAHARGAVVGGTSAGASIMSEFMIAMGEEGLTPRQRVSQMSHGLGLVKGVVIDQHFAQRTRYGRLMSVTAMSPNLVGVGIDEDTAIEVHGSSSFTVRGSGGVFVLDCRNAVTDAPDARPGAPLLVSGAVIHQLPAGSVFDLVGVRLLAFTENHPDLGITKAMAKA
ncbi:MAG: cyanophycinase [Nostocoides sp.]